MTHVVELARLALQVVVDALPLLRLPADEIGREHEGGPQRGGGAHPVGHVLATQAVVRHHGHRVLRQSRAAAPTEVQRADGAPARLDEIACVELEDVHFDPTDPAHRRSLPFVVGTVPA